MTHFTRLTTLKQYGFDERGHRIETEHAKDADGSPGGEAFHLARFLVAFATLAVMAGLSFVVSIYTASSEAETADAEPGLVEMSLLSAPVNAATPAKTAASDVILVLTAHKAGAYAPASTD